MGIEDILQNSNPNEIKKLIALLQSVVDMSTPDQEHKESSGTQDNTSSNSGLKTKSRKFSNNTSNKNKIFENKFLDMPEKAMHKEDIEFDKKVSKHAPVPRNRSFEPINVVCRVCGKDEKVNPGIVDSVQRYKCNACSGQAG